MGATFGSSGRTPDGKPAGCRFGFKGVSRQVYWSPNNKKGSKCQSGTKSHSICLCGKRTVAGRSEFVLTGLSVKNVIR